MMRHQSIHKVIFCGVALISTLVFGPNSSAGAVDALPAGYGDFVPEVDFGPAMSTLVDIGATPCVVKSSNVSSLPAQTKMDLPPADIMQFLGVLTEMKRSSTSLVAFECTPTIRFTAAETSITGKVSNQSLGLTGTFLLKCSFKQSITVTTSLEIGMSVQGGSRMSISPTNSSIPISCGIRIALSDQSTLSGTVEGTATVGTEAPCAGSTDNSCVGISADTQVVVTSGTGELKGYVGSGTYTFQDAFTLPKINESLGQAGQALGKSSVRAMRSVPRTENGTGAMNIKFVPGAAKTEILYPAVVAGTKSSFGKGATYAAVSAPKAKCVFTTVKGSKQYALPAVTANAQGATVTKALTSAQATGMSKALGLKVGAAFVLRAKCGTATTNQNVVFRNT